MDDMHRLRSPYRYGGAPAVMEGRPPTRPSGRRLLRSKRALESVFPKVPLD